MPLALIRKTKHCTEWVSGHTFAKSRCRILISRSIQKSSVTTFVYCAQIFPSPAFPCFYINPVAVQKCNPCGQGRQSRLSPNKWGDPPMPFAKLSCSARMYPLNPLCGDSIDFFADEVTPENPFQSTAGTCWGSPCPRYV